MNWTILRGAANTIKITKNSSLVISISISAVIQRTLPPFACGGSVETTGSPIDRALTLLPSLSASYF